ncbi:hypothetical protein BJ875DRAFT_544957 [Amylocarpus encephaloides]|uniref:Uncharacterized protein n=1 Tax=Amylocarpus encephaloides TaxID=45428 RepID=A0A9P7YE38_9HELO|nr:hypothetical protein BJ875DRAFT_544957 [Amylocarpus encephaloides]
MPLVQQEGRVFGNSKDGLVAGDSVYAVIVEIDGVGSTSIKREGSVPIIALFDCQSRDSWVSQGCVDYLSSYTVADLKTKFPIRRRNTSETPLIRIRWSCGRLGQNFEEGTFQIKPHAQFKILFGSGSEATESSVHPFRHLSLSSSSSMNIHSSKINNQARISARAVNTFREGIENRILLPLRTMPSILDINESLYPSAADLEEALNCLYSTSTAIDESLRSYDDGSNSNSSHLAEVLRTVPRFAPSDDTYTDSYDECNTRSSPASSVADDLYSKRNSQSISEVLRQQRSTPYSHDRWLNQPTQEEPASFMFARVVQQQRREVPKQTVQSLGIVPCQELSPTAQAMLDEAKRNAEKHANEYWIWDEEVGRYKHFDDGCDEPIWYSPP